MNTVLDIETKEDSAEKLAAVAGKPTKNYLFAEELNNIVKWINTKLLSKETENYEEAQLPLADEDKLFVIQSGVAKIVSKKDIGEKRKQVLSYTTNNFSVPNLNNIAFISSNAGSAGDTIYNSGFTDPLHSMTTFNAKLLEAPYRCKVNWVSVYWSSGGHTGNFYLGSGDPTNQTTGNNVVLNAINSKQIIADIPLQGVGFKFHKYYHEIVNSHSIEKGDGFFMMQKAITQDHPARYRFLCTFEIEEID